MKKIYVSPTVCIVGFTTKYSTLLSVSREIDGPVGSTTNSNISENWSNEETDNEFD